MTVALSGMTIELGMDNPMGLENPHRVALRVGLDKDFAETDVYAVMDLLTNVGERERLKKKLADLKAQQQSNKERLIAGRFDRELVALKDEADLEIEVLRDARNAFDQQASESWANSARRGERKLTGRQESDLAKFDAQIAQKQQELNEKMRQNRKMKRDVELGIPVTEWQIDCLYARIAGQTEPAMPDEVAENIKKIEMPEDVTLPETVSFNPPIAA